PIDGWNFIASPIVENITPTDVNGLVYSENDMPYVNSMYYDLYRLNNTTWENFKAHQNGFVLENGKGYLYATAVNTTIKFIGNTYEGDTKTVNISQGYNLVGNPFFVDAYIDRPYYKMNAAGTDIEAVTDYINNPIPIFTGVVVEASGDNETVTFTREAPSLAAPNNGSLQLTLTQTNVRSDAVQDKAIVSFNEGSQLEKFVFNESHAKLYIPQGYEDYAIASVEKRGEVPVSFKATKNGTYTITVNPEAVSMAYLHLIDHITGTDIDLLATPSYSFEGRISDYASRFKLVFVKNDDNLDNQEDFAFISNGEIVVLGEGTLQIIDMMGRVITNVETSYYGVSTNGMAPGVYVLQLISGENVRTQKIVIQ
nr:T9SS type A sorting domain-containing protein [Bacteroidales bacterium]